MSAYTLPKPTTDPVIGILNSFAFDAAVTIQNATGASLSIEITNQNVQEVDAGSIVWADPPGGVKTIADGEEGILESPHVAFRASGTGTGDIYIVQG